jgi:hypothetical protein
MEQLVVVWTRGARLGLERGALPLFTWKDRLAGKVDRRAFADPGGAFVQDGVGHQVHELVSNRAIEDAAITQHGQRQQVHFVPDDGA